MNDEKITLDLVIDVQKDFRQYRIILSAIRRARCGRC